MRVFLSFTWTKIMTLKMGDMVETAPKFANHITDLPRLPRTSQEIVEIEARLCEENNLHSACLISFVELQTGEENGCL